MRAEESQKGRDSFGITPITLHFVLGIHSFGALLEMGLAKIQYMQPKKLYWRVGSRPA